MAGYRSKSSYRAKTEMGRKNQMSNLRSGKKTTQKRFDLRYKKILQNLSIIDFATKYLGISFKERPAQEVILRSLYGLPLDKKQIEIYKKLATNKQVFESDNEKSEAVLCLGARSGKSLLSSICALYEAICRAAQWRKSLLANETGYVCIVATRQKQAEAVCQANCARLLSNSPLKKLIKSSLKTELSLTNGMSILSLPCNSTAGRGLPIACLIMDEVGHFSIEGFRADENIYNSLRPRMSQFSHAKLFLISTPSAKQGLFWDFYSEGFQVPSRLTVQAETKLVNPLVDDDFLAKEQQRNPDNYEREFLAKFAEKVDAFFDSAKLDACFVLSSDNEYQSRYKYQSGIDQSGLTGRDRFAFAISHYEKDSKKVIVDCVRSWSTKDSEAILSEIQSLANAYNLRTVSIDRYGAGWVQQALEKLGLEVTVRPSLPDVYVNFKSLVISGRVTLPINRELRDGLIQTQAYYSRSNTLSIGHERMSTGHGDLADAVVTGVYESSKVRDVQKGKIFIENVVNDWADGDDDFSLEGFVRARMFGGQKPDRENSNDGKGKIFIG